MGRSVEFESGIPPEVEKHLVAIADETGIHPKEEAIAHVQRNWVEKRRLFTEQVEALSMETVSEFSAEDRRGVLFLTYSASLIVLGPADPESGNRFFEYASIKTRTDVPELVKSEEVRLTESVSVGRPALFSGVPIQRSSEILLIATVPEGISPAEQSERLRQGAIFLTNGFVDANRSLFLDETDQPDQFDIRSIVRYVADRNETTQVYVRRIIDDFLSTVETGALLGRRVSIGSIGRLSLEVRNPQKARMGRNPGTGEEILIPAKPAIAVPKIGFSASFRERASRVPIDRIEDRDEKTDERE